MGAMPRASGRSSVLITCLAIVFLAANCEALRGLKIQTERQAQHEPELRGLARTLQSSGAFTTPGALISDPGFSPYFTILVEAALKANLLPYLFNSTFWKHKTLLLPPDGAWPEIFTYFNVSGVSGITGPVLNDILSYHVLPFKLREPPMSGPKLGKVTTAFAAEPDSSSYMLGNAWNGTYYFRDTLFRNASVIAGLDDFLLAGGSGSAYVINRVLLPTLVYWNTPVALLSYFYPFLSLSTLVGFISESGVVSTLSDPAVNLTLLAPVDTAFGAVGFHPSGSDPKTSVDYLLECHAIQGGQLIESWTNGTMLQTLVPGASLMVSRDKAKLGPITLIGQGLLKGRNAMVLVSDIGASAGGSILHTISSVLVPPPQTCGCGAAGD